MNPRQGLAEEMVHEDDFADLVIEDAHDWTISKESLRFGLPAAEGIEPPAAGDRVRFWPAPTWGTRIRGAALRGVVVFYRTPEEQDEMERGELAELQEREQAEFEEEKDDLDRRFDALPEPFRRRIEHRRERNPDFRWKHESYELFCCEEAIKIAAVAREAEESAAWLREWWQSPAAAQAAAIPNLDPQHSGNTFSVAAHLALAWLRDDDAVVRSPGAQAGLYGLVAYGDATAGELLEIHQGTLEPGDHVVRTDPDRPGVGVVRSEDGEENVGVEWFPTRGIFPVPRAELRKAMPEEAR